MSAASAPAILYHRRTTAPVRYCEGASASAIRQCCRPRLRRHRRRVKRAGPLGLVGFGCWISLLCRRPLDSAHEMAREARHHHASVQFSAQARSLSRLSRICHDLPCHASPCHAMTCPDPTLPHRLVLFTHPRPRFSSHPPRRTALVSFLSPPLCMAPFVPRHQQHAGDPTRAAGSRAFCRRLLLSSLVAPSARCGDVVPPPLALLASLPPSARRRKPPEKSLCSQLAPSVPFLVCDPLRQST